MKTITVREAQHNLAKILLEVERGDTVELLRRKHPVARLVPIESSVGSGESVDWDGHEEQMTALWQGTKVEGVDALLEDLRGER